MLRGVIEKYTTNVHTLVSLSSPQGGQYGGRPCTLSVPTIHIHS